MPLSRASTRGRYSRIMGVTAALASSLARDGVSGGLGLRGVQGRERHSVAGPLVVLDGAGDDGGDGCELAEVWMHWQSFQ